ncbi:hypothetical protein GCM10020331_008160 [Ectobacillus funiculus]
MVSGAKKPKKQSQLISQAWIYRYYCSKKRDMIRVERQKFVQVETLSTRYYSSYCQMVPTIPLSFRNLVEVMEERGVSMAHTTIMRWIHQYRDPELDKRSGVISGKRMPHEESMRPISR